MSVAARVLTGDARGWRTLELLDAYAPRDARERADKARMLELLATTPRPFDRHQFAPGHFTASAFVVSPSHDRVLLIEHPTLALWLQPGGHIEPEDTDPMSGARREVLEETGLLAATRPTLFDIDIHEIPSRASAPAHLHYDLRFVAEVDGLPEPGGAEGVACRWLTRAEALALTTDQSVRRMVGKY